MKVTAKVDKYICERCGYVWISRIITEPKLCPSCKSTIWNVPKEEKKV